MNESNALTKNLLPPQLFIPVRVNFHSLMKPVTTDDKKSKNIMKFIQTSSTPLGPINLELFTADWCLAEVATPASSF